MILALLLQAAVPSLGALPKQALPAKACAAYLWSVADRRFVAMASAEPAGLRVMLDGAVVDAVRANESGTGDYGFAASTAYLVGDVSATLDMTVTRRADVSAGALVPSGTLTIGRAGQDSLVVPVAGMIGCS